MLEEFFYENIFFGIFNQDFLACLALDGIQLEVVGFSLKVHWDDNLDELLSAAAIT